MFSHIYHWLNMAASLGMAPYYIWNQEYPEMMVAPLLH